MPLSIAESLPILKMAAYPPDGVPLGKEAMLVRLPPELLDALQASIESQNSQNNAAGPSNGMKLKGGRDASLNKQPKSPFDLVVDDQNALTFKVGDKSWNVSAIQDSATTEIYSRHTTPPLQHAPYPHAPERLQLVAKVQGRLNVSRELDPKIQESVRQSTERAEQSRSTAIIVDDIADLRASSSKAGRSGKPKLAHPRSSPQITSIASTANAKIGSKKPSRASSATAAIPGGSTSIAALTPPKSDGSPSSSTTSRNGRTKHDVPTEFLSSDYNVPPHWEPSSISLPLRVIHCMAPTPGRTEEDILEQVISTHFPALAAMSSLQEKITLTIKTVGIMDPTTLRWTLKDAAYYYVRPWTYPDYATPKVRAEATKQTRPALRRLGYDVNDEEMEWVRRPLSGAEAAAELSRSASARPVVHAQSQQPKIPSSVDLVAKKREAELNPAPKLTSTQKPGFFSAPSTTKPKKTKEPKEPKEKKEGTKKRVKAETAESSAKPSPSPAKASLQDASKPLSGSPAIRGATRLPPGSADGKQHAQRRIQEDERSSATPPPARTSAKPSPSPAAPAPAKRKSDATDALPPTKKRKLVAKVEDESEEEVPLKTIKHKAVVDPSLKASKVAPGTKPVLLPSTSSGKKRKAEEDDDFAPAPKARKSDALSQPRTSTGHSRSMSASSATGEHSKSAGRSTSTPAKRSQLRNSITEYTSSEEDERPLATMTKLKTKMVAVEKKLKIKEEEAASSHRRTSSGEKRPIDEGMRVDVIKQEAAKVLSRSPPAPSISRRAPPAGSLNVVDQTTTVLAMKTPETVHGLSNKFKAISALDDVLFSLMKAEMAKVTSVGVGGDRSMMGTGGKEWLLTLKEQRKKLSEAAGTLRERIERASTGSVSPTPPGKKEIRLLA